MRITVTGGEREGERERKEKRGDWHVTLVTEGERQSRSEEVAHRIRVRDKSRKGRK